MLDRHVIHDERELFAAIMGGKVERPAGEVAQHAPDAAQGLVTRLMSVSVVVRLEVVHVDHQDSHRADERGNMHVTSALRNSLVN